MRPFAKRLFIRPTCEIRVTFLVTLHLHEVQCPHEILVLSPDYRFVGIQFPPDDATKIWRYPVKTHPPTPTYTIEWKREGSIRIIIHSVDEGLRSWINPVGIASPNRWRAAAAADREEGRRLSDKNISI